MAEKSLGYVELVWTCPNCNTKNPGPIKTCQSCGSPQPENVVFEQAEDAQILTDQSKIEQAKKGADIHCGFCGARNPADAITCSQCGGDIKEGKARQSGQVLGSFEQRAGPLPDQKCPNCATMNPGTAKTCSSCGASLVPAGKPKQPAAPAAAEPQKKVMGLPIGCVIALGIAILIAICGIIFLIIGGSTKEQLTGTVQDIGWQRVIEIEEYKDVTKEDWKDEIPAGAVIGACEKKFHHEQDQPAPDAQEVCGTPYTVDTGSGHGEVKQDCIYKVSKDYCKYQAKDWVKVDEAVLKGNDINPKWPSLALNPNQRKGDQSQIFNITFKTSKEIYKYTTSDEKLFIKCTPGSQWTLNINAFNDVIGIEPK